MNRLIPLMIVWGLVPVCFAQEAPLYLSSAQQPIQLSAGVLYQEYQEDDRTLSEVSVPLAVFVPVGRRVGLSFHASQASATGDSLEGLSGFSDAQLGASYQQPLGAGSAVFSLGLNLPSGKRELSEDEFTTSIFLSQHFYNFRVPGFGQGLNIAPGVVLAYPLGETVVAGVGASYQIKGTYRPQVGMDDDYDPGDELLLTGGLNVRMGEATDVSADLTYTLYAADELGGSEVYANGDKVTATLQLLNSFGAADLRLVARYRSQAKSSLPSGVGVDAQELRALPAQVLLGGTYRQPFGERLRLGAIAQARFFGETDFYDARSLFDAGLAPEVRLTDTVGLHARFVYTLGDLTGFEAGGGLAVEL